MVLSMPSEVRLISISEYARWRGCTEGAVRRAIRDRRIAMIDGKIDPVAADAQWAANSRPRAQAPNTAPQTPGQAQQPTRDDDVDGPRAYWASRSRRERAEAALAELRLAEQSGELVRVTDVRSTYAKKAAGLREALLQIPARLAAPLAAEAQIARCHDLLQDELHTVLSSVALPPSAAPADLSTHHVPKEGNP
jgi:anti-sigma factor ChrR (cupin superfamily)